jgi:hypothetical protein
MLVQWALPELGHRQRPTVLHDSLNLCTIGNGTQHDITFGQYVTAIALPTTVQQMKPLQAQYCS